MIMEAIFLQTQTVEVRTTYVRYIKNIVFKYL